MQAQDSIPPVDDELYMLVDDNEEEGEGSLHLSPKIGLNTFFALITTFWAFS